MKCDILLNDLLLLTPDVFSDHRGYFFEAYNNKTFSELSNFDSGFVQDNQSHSRRGVLRGLHLQSPPFGQGKLVRVVRGEILDVVVDVRSRSKSFGDYCTTILNDASGQQLWIPEGFAHGFVVLSETADVIYKTTNYYSPGSELAIRWDDPFLNIDWCTEEDNLIVSSKDASALLFHDFCKCNPY